MSILIRVLLVYVRFVDTIFVRFVNAIETNIGIVLLL